MRLECDDATRFLLLLNSLDGRHVLDMNLQAKVAVSLLHNPIAKFVPELLLAIILGKREHQQNSEKADGAYSVVVVRYQQD